MRKKIIANISKVASQNHILIAEKSTNNHKILEALTVYRNRGDFSPLAWKSNEQLHLPKYLWSAPVSLNFVHFLDNVLCYLNSIISKSSIQYHKWRDRNLKRPTSLPVICWKSCFIISEWSAQLSFKKIFFSLNSLLLSR